MSEVLRAALGMFAVIAPFGGIGVFLAYTRAADGPQSPRPELAAAIAPAAALPLFALAVLIADPFLDWLNISPENFQFAAGTLMFPVALRLFWEGNVMPLPEDEEPRSSRAWLVPLAVPLLAGPASIIAAISYAARFGEGEAIAAIALVLLASAALFAVSARVADRLRPLALATMGRLSAALLVIVAVELIVDGVRSV